MFFPFTVDNSKLYRHLPYGERMKMISRLTTTNYALLCINQKNN